jgi:rare lipoprotein A
MTPRGWSETGIASWYGHPYHGRRAANGEIYDMEQLTAAHKTLPFDTIVKVTSLANGKSVTVRITDRGPFIEGRVIDLSRAAARQIGMIGPGIMRVRLEAVAQASLRGNGGGARFGVQVGVFQDRSRAERVRRELEERYAPVRLVEREGSAKQWRVLVGDKASQQDALELAAELQRTHAGAFVVRIDADAR